MCLNLAVVHYFNYKINSYVCLLQDQPKPKVLPEFESYIVEDEEGSGTMGLIISCLHVTLLLICLSL